MHDKDAGVTAREHRPGRFEEFKVLRKIEDGQGTGEKVTKLESLFSCGETLAPSSAAWLQASRQTRAFGKIVSQVPPRGRAGS
jgi:hypothetical protein